jgi:hypothetical protein
MFVISGILILFGMIVGLPIDPTETMTTSETIRFFGGYTMFISGAVIAGVASVKG